jgi:hypothetical protein
MISNLIPRQKLVGYRHRARTLLLLALLLLAAFGSAFAGQMYVGLHGGPNIPSLKGGTNIMSEGYVSRLGPNFGIFANYAIRGHFSLRGEINYSSEGGKRTGMQPFYPSKEMSQLLPVGTPLPLYGVFDNEAILDYLEIPVMAKMTWGRIAFLPSRAPTSDSSFGQRPQRKARARYTWTNRATPCCSRITISTKTPTSGMRSIQQTTESREASASNCLTAPGISFSKPGSLMD